MNSSNNFSQDHPSDSDKLIEHSLTAFEAVVNKSHSFRHRPGQYEMAKCIAQTFAQVDFSKDENYQQAITVIQAGTGIGKSAAYASVAIAQSLERGVKVIISTATVSLQEQLMQKDLPLLASNMDKPFKYALAKGRGRYLCLMKCDRNTTTAFEEENLFESSKDLNGSEIEIQRKRRQSLALEMLTLYEDKKWNGEKDTWSAPLAPNDWSRLCADSYSCTGKHCTYFKDCCYFKARQELIDADVIIANHDLVLASLGKKTLPELNQCLLIFDEAHHLPAIAIEQFSSSMDLSNLRWLDNLPKVLGSASATAAHPLNEDTSEQCGALKLHLQDFSRLTMDMVLHKKPPTENLRFADGIFPESLTEITRQIANLAGTLAKTASDIALKIKANIKEHPGESLALSQEISRLSQFYSHLSDLANTSQLLLEHEEPPLAKWIAVKETGNSFLQISAYACPIVPGDLLYHFLWSKVRTAVLTSASLTSCGRFDFFLKESGLNNKAYIKTLEVATSFDYKAQGTIQIIGTQCNPKDAVQYTKEIAKLLINDLEQAQKGVLVLFTSKAQMQTVVESLPKQLLEKILVQNQQSRAQLLEAHRIRIKNGETSILFGMQSFGEGLDLPGELCETLIITKIPFSSPSNPVGEARNEWLNKQGRDAFMELVIPATGVRFLQWTGRAIRTENDSAKIICYDKRLTQTNYGRLILSGLPKYKQL